ncbi:MAG: 30S ribosomal protein S6 [Sedimentisphaerales bacterium]|nr:30S ribosomal protein S6 [Sedimentisphaerales bacterium]
MESVKKLYESMFLIDSAEAARDWDGILDFIRKILTKAEAEIISMRKWDERPLAYPVGRCTRGTYILAYIRVNGQKVGDIERDVRLSERIMRALILRADHLTEEDMAKDTPAERTEKQRILPEVKPSAEGETSPNGHVAVTDEVVPAAAEAPEAVVEESGAPGDLQGT